MTFRDRVKAALVDGLLLGLKLSVALVLVGLLVREIAQVRLAAYQGQAAYRALVGGK